MYNLVTRSTSRMNPSTFPPRISPLTKPEEVIRALEYALQRLHSFRASGKCPEAMRSVVTSLIELFVCLSPQSGGRPAEKVDDFFKIITAFDETQTALVNGANAQVAEIAEEIETLRASKGRIVDSGLVAKIEAAIRFREIRLKNIDTVLNGNGEDNPGLMGRKLEFEQALQNLENGAYEKEEDAKKEKSDIQRKLRLVEESIEEQTTFLHRVTSEIQELTMDKAAIERAAKGPRPELLVLDKK